MANMIQINPERIPLAEKEACQQLINNLGDEPSIIVAFKIYEKIFGHDYDAVLLVPRTVIVVEVKDLEGRKISKLEDHIQNRVLPGGTQLKESPLDQAKQWAMILSSKLVRYNDLIRNRVRLNYCVCTARETPGNRWYYK